MHKTRWRHFARSRAVRGLARGSGSGSVWRVAVWLAVFAVLLPVFPVGPVGAQGAVDADETRSGAQDLGDVTEWDEPKVFDNEVDGADDSVDYFRFSLSEPRLVVLRLRRMEFDADLFVEVPSGWVLASSQKNGTVKELISIGLAAGDYLVRVEAREQGSNAYRLKVAAKVAPEGTVFHGNTEGVSDKESEDGELVDGSVLRSAHDPDSTPSGATDWGDVTGWSSPRTFDDSVDGGDDVVDYFAFTLTATKRIGAGLSFMELNADIFLENSFGTVLASGRNRDNRRERLNTELGPGDYLLRVQAQQGGLNTYEIFLQTAKPDSVTAGFDTSAVVRVGACFEGADGANILPEWDIDWVRVELTAGEVYVLEVRGRDSGSGALVDPELKAVYVDPSDAAVFDTYDQAGRSSSDGLILDNGLSSEDLDEDGSPDILDMYPNLPGPVGSPDPFGEKPVLSFTEAYDLDDGLGQDAWLLFRAEEYRIALSRGRVPGRIPGHLHGCRGRSSRRAGGVRE